MGNRVSVDINARDKASKPIKDVHDAFTRLQKVGVQGLAIGAGATITAGAFGLLQDAISGVGSVLVDSIRKAADEQAGIAKLDQALQDNVKGWNGNRDAIEEVIAQREKLAFSDQEQRDALAQLVTRTHDVNKALDLERTAMDLARLKGLDLATSTEIIGKVYGGNIGILSRYGIAVTKGATATQAIAEIQRSAAGQAEKYANTTQGSFESLGVAVENLQEEIGTALLPTLRDLTIWARDEGVPAMRSFFRVLEDGKPLLELLSHTTLPGIADGMKRADDSTLNAAERMRGLVDETVGALPILGNIIRWGEDYVFTAGGIGDSTSKIDGVIGDFGRHAPMGVGKVSTAFTILGGDAYHASAKVGRALDDIVSAARKARDDLKNLGSEASDALYGPIIAKAQLAADQIALKEAELNAKKKGLRGADLADAQLAVDNLRKTVFDDQIAVLGYTQANSAQQKVILDDLKKQWKSATGEAKTDLANLIAYIQNLNSSAHLNITVRNTGKAGANFQRAAGGPLPPYGTSLVGENGPEIIRLGSAGATVNPSASTSAGGGSTLVINVNGVSVLTPGAARALADQIAPAVTRWQQMRGV